MTDEVDRPWRVQVLGPVEIRPGAGGPVDIAQTKIRSLLAHLAVAAEAIVPTDQLVEGLWGDAPPRSAVKTLHGYVARLRRLTDRRVILTAGNGYRLNPELVTVDSALLAELVDRAATEPSPQHRVAVLARALQLYRGAPLADVPSDYLRTRYGAGLAERRLTVLEEWGRAGLQAGRTEVVSALLAATAEYPFRERLWEVLILAQARYGQRTEAMRSYRRVRNLLRDQLGVEPGEELRRAHRTALATDTANNPRGPVDPLPGPHGDLARQVVAAVGGAPPGQAGGQRRSVVLRGSPGGGKTTVARQVAESLRPMFPGGVTAVSLADEPCPPTPAGVAHRLVKHWQVAAPAPAPDVVFAARQAWQERACLLVLDDVAPGTGLGELLPAPPGCAVIVCGAGSAASPGTADHRLVDRLTEPQVAELLRRHVGADRWDRDPRVAQRLVEFSDGLAAAVHAIAIRLAPGSSLRLAELADRLAVPERRLAELTAGTVSVRSHLLRAYRRLNPMQQRAFRLLGLIRAASFPPRVARACLDGTEADTRELLDGLLAGHLLYASTPASAGVRYRFGALESLFARELSRDSDSPAERAAAVDRALAAWSAERQPLAPVAPSSRVPRPQLIPMSAQRTVR